MNVSISNNVQRKIYLIESKGYNHDTLIFRNEQLRLSDLSAIANNLKINTTIKYLDLSNTTINDECSKELEDTLKSNSCLQKLDLSNNHFTFEGAKRIFNGIKINQSIEYLNLSNNNLESDEILNRNILISFQFNKTLKYLDLSNTRLSNKTFITILKALSNNTSIIEINLSHNNITGEDCDEYFINCFKVNNTLKSLILSHNNLSNDFISSISEAINQEECVLSKLSLSSLPETSKEGIFQLMKGLINNTCIIELDVSYNLITSILSEIIDKNTTLRKLNIESTNIISEDLIDISLALENNTTLEDLNISSIQSQPDAIPSFSEALKKNKSLKRLNISNLDLGDNGKLLSEGILNASSLESLVMNQIHMDNKSDIQTFITDILKNKSLKELIMNQIYLDIDDINCMAKALDENSTLEKLSIQNNDIPLSSLQPLINSYQNSLELISIDISQDINGSFSRKTFNNRNLKSFHSSILKMKHLTHLNLSNNLITYIPEEICILSSLEYLDISNNRLLCLPISLCDLPRLKCLKCDNNNFKTPPPEILKNDSLKSIIDFLRDLKNGHEALYRTKLMLVGQENVGKTTLLKSIKSFKQNRYSMKKKHPNISTDGIDIDEFQLDVAFNEIEEEESESPLKSIAKLFDFNSRTNVTINAWDFAGQEIYYTTHQFFLSKRSIYILVWDLRSDDDCKINFWLQSIRSRTKNSSVIIVGTHSDYMKDNSMAQLKADRIFAKFQPRFPFIKNSLAISCKNVNDISYLLDILRETIREQHHMGELIPKRYLEFERIIKEERIKSIKLNYPPIRSWNEMKDLAISCNIKDEHELKRCIQFLHDIGVLLYFDDAKMNLSDTVIIDPQFLTDVMATIVTTKHKIKHGILSKQTLSMIWRPPKFPEEIHLILLTLLEKFEILYTLPESLKAKVGHIKPHILQIHSLKEKGDVLSYNDDNIDILIPSLLPENKPNVELLWIDFDPNVIQYDRIYKIEFMPNGLFSRLMIRALHYVDSVSTYWRNGIIGTRDNAMFCLELLEYESMISLSVRGQKSNPPIYIMLLLIDMIESFFGLNKWFNIPVKTFVPCPHCIENGLKDYQVRMFSIIDLKNLIQRGTFTVGCNTLDEICYIDISRLLPDLVYFYLQKFKINFNDIELIEKNEISKSEINYQGQYKNHNVLVKTVNSEFSFDHLKDYNKEVWILSKLNHPNIIRLFGYTIEPFSIVLESSNYGTLYDYIHINKHPLDWNLLLKIALDISKAMHYLHYSSSPPFLHRNLQTKNIFIVNDDPFTDICAKIANFENSSRSYSQISKPNSTNPNDFIYLPPEVLNNQEYTEKSDVYSFGMILWELYTKSIPYSEFNITFSFELEDMIKNGIRPTLSDDMDDDFYCLIQACWCQNPDERLNFEDIIKWLITISTDLAPDISISEDLLSNNLSYNQENSDNYSSHSDEICDITRIFSGEMYKHIRAENLSPIKSLCNVGNYVWSGHIDGSLSVWNGKSGELLVAYNGNFNTEVSSIIYAGGYIWTLWKFETCSIWKVHDFVDILDSVFHSVGVRKEGYINQVTSWTRSEETRYLVIENNALKIYKDKGGELLFNSSLDDVTINEYQSGNEKYGFQVNFESFKPILFICKDEETQKNWINSINELLKVNENKQYSFKHIKDIHMKDISCLSFINNQIWGGTTSCSIKMWDIETLELVNHVKFDISSIEEIKDDGSIYFTTLSDFDGCIWIGLHNYILCVERETLLPIRLMKSHTDKVVSIVGVDDNIWSCSYDGTIKVWGKTTYQCHLTYSELGGKQEFMMKHSQYILSVGQDGRIRAFNPKTLELERSLIDKQNDSILTLCPVGSMLWAGCNDGSILILK